METPKTFPKIVQGGMGVNISSWVLARTVSMLGQQGTVSGVALERVVARLLQMGDPGGHLRRALSNFPYQQVAQQVLNAFYVEGGVPAGTLAKSTPVFTAMPSNLLIALTVCANFAFVWLAKEGHNNPVSINYLEKIAMPHVYAITGAMLAEVDFITMGAGIPLQIPEVISSIAEGKPASYRVPVIGKNVTSCVMSFHPKSFFGTKLPLMRKPGFIPIIASNLLGNVWSTRNSRKKLPEGSVYGLVVEEPTAGGHNAPPRKPVYNDRGEPEPIYGSKDVVDYGEIAALGWPFWIGGSKASPEKLAWALSVGAKGIQAGSIFALCEESGMDPAIRNKVRALGWEGKLRVVTDMRISPTGFPFKVAVLDGTLSERSVYRARERICDQGALVRLYERGDGTIGYRCPAAAVDKFVAKGGAQEDTAGRGCLCNGLFSTAGLGFEDEPPVVTMGDDVSFLPKIMANRDSSYSAKDAMKYLLGSVL